MTYRRFGTRRDQPRRGLICDQASTRKPQLERSYPDELKATKDMCVVLLTASCVIAWMGMMLASTYATLTMDRFTPSICNESCLPSAVPESIRGMQLRVEELFNETRAP